VALMRFECRFGLVLSAHSDMVITCTQIQFVEDFGADKLIQQLVNHWHGKDIFDSEFVQTTVVDVKPLGTIFLQNHKNRRSKRGHARGNDAIS
jgi:hypothetical protein